MKSELLIAAALVVAPLLHLEAAMYARFEDDGGVSHFASLTGGTLDVLDAAPWAGGKPTGERVAIEKVRLLPPSVPRNIIGLAGAYVRNGMRPARDTIRWFSKSPSAAAASGEDVPVPQGLDTLKAEVELVAIIGRRCRNLTPEQARAAIFGFCTGTEIFGFAQDFYQTHRETPPSSDTMLEAGLKLGDKMAPFGPLVHTSVDWRELSTTLRVIAADGKVSAEYHDSTKGMLHTPAEAVSQLSQIMTLEPGDVIFTGSTKSFIVHAGDTVETEVAGLGRLRNRIVPPPSGTP